MPCIVGVQILRSLMAVLNQTCLYLLLDVKRPLESNPLRQHMTKPIPIDSARFDDSNGTTCLSLALLSTAISTYTIFAADYMSLRRQPNREVPQLPQF